MADLNDVWAALDDTKATQRPKRRVTLRDLRKDVFDAWDTLNIPAPTPSPSTLPAVLWFSCARPCWQTVDPNACCRRKQELCGEKGAKSGFTADCTRNRRTGVIEFNYLCSRQGRTPCPKGGEEERRCCTETDTMRCNRGDHNKHCMKYYDEM
jgi:hypothetical protein